MYELEQKSPGTLLLQRARKAHTHVALVTFEITYSRLHFAKKKKCLFYHKNVMKINGESMNVL